MLAKPTDNVLPIDGTTWRQWLVDDQREQSTMTVPSLSPFSTAR